MRATGVMISGIVISASGAKQAAPPFGMGEHEVVHYPFTLCNFHHVPGVTLTSIIVFKFNVLSFKPFSKLVGGIC
jgi:hypothetical protein